jgi:hypothetical protein
MKSIEIQLTSKDMMIVITLEDTQQISIDIENMMTTMIEIITLESIIYQEIETMMIIMKEDINHIMMINTDLGMKGMINILEMGIEEAITMMIDMDILIVIMYSEELMMLSDKLMSILEEIDKIEILSQSKHNQMTNKTLNLLNLTQNQVKFNLEKERVRIMLMFQRERKMKIHQKTLNYLKKMMMNQLQILKKKKSQRSSIKLKSTAKSRKNIKRSTTQRKRIMMKTARMKRFLHQRKRK